MSKSINIEMMTQQKQSDKDNKIERQLNSIAKNRFKTQEILSKEHIENSDLKMALANEYVKKYGKVKSMYIDSMLFGLGIVIVAALVQHL